MSESQLDSFLNLIVKGAIAEKREVMLTDALDYCIFHTKNGKIIWPTPDLVPPKEDT